jgi:cation diffusion facilitator family transporter
MFHPEPSKESFRSRVAQRVSEGQQIALVSFFVNVIVGIAEVGVGSVFGSLALTADGVHSFVDAVVSLLVWFGIRFSQKKADGKFHYGYYKFDAIFSLFAAMIMVASGIVIGYTGIESYLKPVQRHGPSLVPIVVVLVSIVAAVVLAKVKEARAKSSGLISLKTDGYNSIKDASASIVALIGIVLSYFGYYAFDSLAALVIGVFVMVAGYIAIRESSNVLADAYGNPEMIETVREIASSVPGVHSIDDLRIRRNGPFLVVEMHARVDGNISVFEADEITKEIVRKMRESIVSLGRITVKPEPAQDTTTKV